MVQEQALFSITPGSEQDFEAAVHEATAIFRQARGFRSLGLRRCIERPSYYSLHIEWDSVADHEEGFRKSDDFKRYRALVGPFFAADPQVEHFEEPAVLG